ncbi:MAG: hypothetical protein WC928_03025 [Patescibacteria group bacterium]|jgi:hypothetical protein
MNIESLIEDGYNLIDTIKNKSKDLSSFELYHNKIFEKALKEYADWQKELLLFLNKNKVNKSIISDIADLETLLIDRENWLQTAQNKNTEPKAVLLYIKNVKDILKLLNKIYSSDSPKVNDLFEKYQLEISTEKGIIRTDNPKLVYPISGKRMGLLQSLKDGKPKSAKEIIEIYNPQKGGLNLLSGEIKNINKTFVKKIHIKKDLIISLNTIGYKLNTDYFIFKF